MVGVTTITLSPERMSALIHLTMSLTWTDVGVGAWIRFLSVSARDSTCMSRGDTIQVDSSATAAAFLMSLRETGPMAKSLWANLSCVTGIAPPETSNVWMSRLVPPCPMLRAASREPQYMSMKETRSPALGEENGISIEMLTSCLPSLTNRSSNMSSIPFFSFAVVSGLSSSVGLNPTTSSTFSGSWTVVRPSQISGWYGILSSCLRLILSEVIPLIFRIASFETLYFFAMVSRSSNHFTLWMKKSSGPLTGAFFSTTVFGS